jgi:hypothetical protein
MPGVVGARAGHHHGPAADRLLHRPDQPDLLVVGEGGRLSGGAHHDNAV